MFVENMKKNHLLSQVIFLFFRRNVEFSELIPQARLQMNKRIKEKLYFMIKVTGG